MTHLSIVIPVLNEAENIQTALRRLQNLRRRGHEVIVVDGGSSDQTSLLAADLADRILSAPCGRALQMNRGAAASNGEILLFLHADTELPTDCDRLIAQALADKCGWGRFDIRLSGHHPLFRVIAACINWRSRISGIATGDQAIFVSRALFEQAGGFPAIPLMEDIALSRRLRDYRRPHCLSARAVTSSRRWERHGILKTVILMWWLRFRYFFGADPDKLARIYRQS
ncbi:MAG TPA: TIGR04283 family arsenosugar biosynthesis glycosyltransferase [Gammaproteobacteria bacterium]|nr:TIGR04283 family arsenosugar biosynthesis glycosyltransferase [Gammaproteobacteria bacterium]